MKILKILGIIVLVIVLLFAGLIIFAPSSAHFERETTINAPAKAVYDEVINMKTFNSWNPWFKMDPDAEYSWEGPTSGIGAKQIWFSENRNVGNGYMIVSEMKPVELVILEMGFDTNMNRDFTDDGESKPQASFMLSESDGITNVKWTFDVEGSSGTEKLMNLVLPMFLGPAYEQGLEDLKERVESKPEFTYDIDQVQTTEQAYIGIEASSSSDPEKIGAVMGQAYGEVFGYMTKNGIESVGAPISIVLTYDEESTSMICGMPTASLVAIDSEKLKSGMTYEGLALKTIHKGDYALMESAYNDLVSYAAYYKFEDNGSPWEVYVTDPGSVPDTAQWVTEIYYPIK